MNIDISHSYFYIVLWSLLLLQTTPHHFVTKSIRKVLRNIITYLNVTKEMSNVDNHVKEIMENMSNKFVIARH